jgi:hypothetical protein
VNNGVKPVTVQPTPQTHPAIHETRAYLEQEYTHLLNGRCPRHPAGGLGCWHNATRDELRRLGKAIDISPTLDICEALLKGQNVPIDKLDLTAFGRYGRRP